MQHNVKAVCSVGLGALILNKELYLWEKRKRPREDICFLINFMDSFSFCS